MIDRRVSDYYKTISRDNLALSRQFCYDPLEEIEQDYEVSDPLDENRYMVVPQLIHRYKDRVLLLVTNECRLYCRHCFRREYVGGGNSHINKTELKAALDYIKNNELIHEVILSGGDPLVLGYKALGRILKDIKSIRKNIVIRIGTRVPIVDPTFITDSMVSMLAENTPIFMAIQCNHPSELTVEVKNILDKLSSAGVVLLNQAVLLKGINDSVEIQKELCHKLLEVRVKPYYLFQGDLAKGTSHFRVPLGKGLEIYSKLRDEVSGIALPIYAVDIPGGGGKVPLNGSFIESEDEDFYYLKNSVGFIGKYPKE